MPEPTEHPQYKWLEETADYLSEYAETPANPAYKDKPHQLLSTLGIDNDAVDKFAVARAVNFILSTSVTNPIVASAGGWIDGYIMGVLQERGRPPMPS